MLQILEQLHAAELRHVNDLLSGLLGAAMVLAEDGTVVAANEAAARRLRAAARRLDPQHAARRGRPRRASPQRIAEVAAGGPGREDIVQLRPTGLDRVVLVHLKPMRGDAGRPHVLAVTSELAWPDAVAEFLAGSSR